MSLHHYHRVELFASAYVDTGEEFPFAVFVPFLATSYGKAFLSGEKGYYVFHNSGVLSLKKKPNISFSERISEWKC